MRQVNMGQVREWANYLASKIKASGHSEYILAGIPRGGISAAYAIALEMVPTTAHVISADDLDSAPPIIDAPVVLVDDILATGETLRREVKRVKPAAACVLIRKASDTTPLSSVEGTLLHCNAAVPMEEWIQFPWETRDSDGGKPEDAVRRLIEWVGDDPSRPGLVDTPRRVLKFLEEIKENPYKPMAFESSVGDLQVTGNIPFSSLCEHHMLPLWGTAAIGYIPNGKLIGLSKASRALASASSGLTVQEEITVQTAELIKKDADTFDVAVVTTAQHSCMIVRGVKAIGSYSVSSAMLGKFRDAPALRAEFMALARVSG